MKINNITERGFYKAVDNDHFVIEIIKLSDLKEVKTDEDLSDVQDELFVDVWYHDSDKPYNHKEGIYQSNGNVYKLEAVPEIFDNMEFIEDFGYTHTIHGEDGLVMYRHKPQMEKQVYN